MVRVSSPQGILNLVNVVSQEKVIACSLPNVLQAWGSFSSNAIGRIRSVMDTVLKLRTLAVT